MPATLLGEPGKASESSACDPVRELIEGLKGPALAASPMTKAKVAAPPPKSWEPAASELGELTSTLWARSRQFGRGDVGSRRSRQTSAGMQAQCEE